MHGFHDVSMVDSNSVVGLAQFDTPGNAMAFIKSQKKHAGIQHAGLWVAEKSESGGTKSLQNCEQVEEVSH